MAGGTGSLPPPRSPGGDGAPFRFASPPPPPTPSKTRPASRVIVSRAGRETHGCGRRGTARRGSSGPPRLSHGRESPAAPGTGAALRGSCAAPHAPAMGCAELPPAALSRPLPPSARLPAHPLWPGGRSHPLPPCRRTSLSLRRRRPQNSWGLKSDSRNIQSLRWEVRGRERLLSAPLAEKSTRMETSPRPLLQWSKKGFHLQQRMIKIHLGLMCTHCLSLCLHTLCAWKTASASYLQYCHSLMTKTVASEQG